MLPKQEKQTCVETRKKELTFFFYCPFFLFSRIIESNSFEPVFPYQYNQNNTVILMFQYIIETIILSDIKKYLTHINTHTLKHTYTKTHIHFKPLSQKTNITKKT